jgi:uncharacterized phage infection (PIP) family protein YhgE
MKATVQITSLTALLILAMAPPVATRAAESADQAKEARARIDATRDGSAKIRNQIGLTLEELNRLQTPSVELRPQLDKYTAELAKMEEISKTAKERVVSMQEKGKAYFQAWEDQVQSISNSEIREQAQNRYEKRLKSYNRIIKAMTEARDELVPFMSDLNDIKKMLDAELSRESAKSAKNVIKSANWHGDDVVDSLKDVETELDRVSAELAKYK